MLRDDRQADAGGATGGDHLGAFGGGLGHRLLDEQVLAGGGRRERLGQVAGRRRGEDDRVDVVAGEERVKVRLERDPEVGGQGRRRACPPVTAMSDVPLAWLRGDLGPRPAHETRADDADPDGHAVGTGCRSKKSIPAVRQSSMNSYSPSSVLWRPGMPAVHRSNPSSFQAASSSARVPTLATRSGSW